MVDLTPERLHELFAYIDGKLYWKVDKSTASAGSEVGHINSHGYRITKIDGVRYAVHRITFTMFHGYTPKVVDHIDGDRSNNAIENLRECTQTQNMLNRKKACTNTTGAKGVFRSSTLGKWFVTIKVNGNNKYIGTFEDFELAELVATEARNKFHGEFARHA